MHSTTTIRRKICPSTSGLGIGMLFMSTPSRLVVVITGVSSHQRAGRNILGPCSPKLGPNKDGGPIVTFNPECCLCSRIHVKADGTEALRQEVARVDDLVGAPTFNLRDFPQRMCRQRNTNLGCEGSPFCRLFVVARVSLGPQSVLKFYKIGQVKCLKF